MASLKSKLTHLLQHCKTMKALKQIHTQILTSPFLTLHHQTHLLTRLLFFSALSVSGSLSHAAAVFRLIQNPNLYLYNIMIRSLAANKSPSFSRPLALYKRMLRDRIVPDCLTLPFLVKDCAARIDVVNGRGVHAQAVMFGLDNQLIFRNSLISMYFVFGAVSDARNVFDEMCERDVVSWNAMIKGCLRTGEVDEAIEVFRKMGERSVVSWNSVITGCVQRGRAREALEFFREMLGVEGGVRPDKVTIASVIGACAHLGAGDYGLWVHEYLRRSGVESDVVIGTALVDMYGKCGLVEKAYEVFMEMEEKDALAWTAMISVLALHGLGNEAFGIFEKMEAAGVEPNHVTFIGLLSACAHCGLVEKGRWCFDVMRHVYLIEPQVYHYACMVDILSRVGLIEEAERLIRSMSMKPDVYVWGALLGGCQIHGHVEIGEMAAYCLIDMEPLNHAFYVNLCDIYAKAGRFNDVKIVKSRMKERGIKKEVAGCSMIEVDGSVLEFSVRGSPDIALEKISWILGLLSNEA